MKPLKINLLFILLTFKTSLLFSQYTEVINSNKPGFSESPYSVGTGVYQFESNFFFKKTTIEPTFSRPESYGLDLLFRTSFFLEKLELNAQLSYQRDKIAFKNIFSSHYFTTGLSKATVGAKYLVFQQEFTDKTKEIRSWKRRNSFDKKRLIPSVAIYVGVNTDFLNDVHKTERITPKLGILLQHDLTDYFNIITNVFYDKMGTDFSELSYIVTATYNFSNRWSTFFENQGIFQKYQTNSHYATGLAYLFNTNLQINASGRAIFEGNSNGFYGSLGISYRINKHKDSYILLDDNGNEIKDTPISRYNKKGFFNRFLNLFKKKSNKKRTRSRRKKSNNK